MQLALRLAWPSWHSQWPASHGPRGWSASPETSAPEAAGDRYQMKTVWWDQHEASAMEGEDHTKQGMYLSVYLLIAQVIMNSILEGLHIKTVVYAPLFFCSDHCLHARNSGLAFETWHELFNLCIYNATLHFLTFYHEQTDTFFMPCTLSGDCTMLPYSLVFSNKHFPYI